VSHVAQLQISTPAGGRARSQPGGDGEGSSAAARPVAWHVGVIQPPHCLRRGLTLVCCCCERACADPPPPPSGFGRHSRCLFRTCRIQHAVPQAAQGTFDVRSRGCACSAARQARARAKRSLGSARPTWRWCWVHRRPGPCSPHATTRKALSD
jgi:hypothetical protein